MLGKNSNVWSSLSHTQTVFVSVIPFDWKNKYQSLNSKRKKSDITWKKQKNCNTPRCRTQRIWQPSRRRLPNSSSKKQIWNTAFGNSSNSKLSNMCKILMGKKSIVSKFKSPWKSHMYQVLQETERTDDNILIDAQYANRRQSRMRWTHSYSCLDGARSQRSSSSRYVRFPNLCQVNGPAVSQHDLRL